MQNNGMDDTRSILYQALGSGVIIGVILLAIVGAIGLTYTVGTSGSRVVSGPAVSLVDLMGTPTPAQGIVLSATATRLVPTSTSSPTASATFTSVPPVSPPSPTLTPSPAPPLCPTPAGWQAYAVQPGDTVTNVAARFMLTEDQLRQANCLAESDVLFNELVLSVPPFIPVPSSSPTAPGGCLPPDGWVLYSVKAGDTLGRLAAACRTSVEAIMSANCLLDDDIFVGQRVSLPCVPPAMPTYVPRPTQAIWWPTPVIWPTATRPRYTPLVTPTPRPTQPYFTPTTRPTRIQPPPTSTPSVMPQQPTRPPAPPATARPTQPPATRPPTQAAPTRVVVPPTSTPRG